MQGAGAMQILWVLYFIIYIRKSLQSILHSIIINLAQAWEYKHIAMNSVSSLK